MQNLGLKIPIFKKFMAKLNFEHPVGDLQLCVEILLEICNFLPSFTFFKRVMLTCIRLFCLQD